MTITNQTNALVECIFDATSTRWLTLRMTKRGTLLTMLYDRGEGYRPFYPLVVKINNEPAVLPAALSEGDNAIELVGASISNAVGLAIRGVGLVSLSEIRLSATQTDPVTYPSTTTEGAGQPTTAGRKTGDWHWDTTAKFWYRLIGGKWQEQA